MTMTRTTSGVVLPKEVSSTIWADAVKGSAVMSVATPISMPGNGVTVPMITGEATAAFVNEGAKKPVSDSSVGNKVITPYKIAVIQAFTDEFRRDADALYAALAERLPQALAARFDSAVFHGPTPGSGFDTLADADALGLDATDTYGDLVAIDGAIAEANGVLNGWVLSPKARGVLLSAKDSTNRPLLLSDIQREGGVGALLGAPVVQSRAAYKADEEDDDGEVLGFAGDWTNAFYGTVEGIKIAQSSEATLTIGGSPVNLFENNMFAVRAEVEVAFAVRDINKFVKIVGANTVE